MLTHDPGINGLDVHSLEAGYESPGRPIALLLHGFRVWLMAGDT